MAKVYISCREDCADICGRMQDWLAKGFSERNVFIGAQVPPGYDVQQRRRALVGQSNVLLVVIGRWWLSDPLGNQLLEYPLDPVRLEIEAALPLAAERKLVLIPVLVHDADIPQAVQLPTSIRDLALINAVLVHSEPYFRQDMTRLATIIRQKLADPIRAARRRRLLGHTPWLTVLSALPIALWVVLFAIYSTNSSVIQSSEAFQDIEVVAVLGPSVTWVACSIVAGRRKQWAWLVTLILSFPLWVVLFVIVTTPIYAGLVEGEVVVVLIAVLIYPLIYCLASR